MVYLLYIIFFFWPIPVTIQVEQRTEASSIIVNYFSNTVSSILVFGIYPKEKKETQNTCFTCVLSGTCNCSYIHQVFIENLVTDTDGPGKTTNRLILNNTASPPL